MSYAREVWSMFREAGANWIEDKAPQLGAALAFYSLLSIAPLVIIAVAVAALVFGEEAASGGLMTQLTAMVGEDGAKAVEEMLASARQPAAGTTAAVLGLITLLFGASGVFAQLQDAMNTVWEVPPKKQSGIWGFIRTRFLSMAMVLGTGFLLLVSLIFSASISAAGTWLTGAIPALEPVLHIANAVVTFLVVTLLFAMIFKFLPDAQVAWRDVWVGALLTAVLFTIGKLAIGLYLGQAALGSAYGAAGSLVVLIVWIYYSAQILFFGAELTEVYARRFGSKIVTGERAHAAEPAREEPSAGHYRPA